VHAANWHLTDRCNYTCKFCFMTNLPFREAGIAEGQMIIDSLRRIGITKLNFVGGEPLLHPHLSDFARIAKEHGLTTSIVTNGSLLTRAKVYSLKPFVDWIGLSIDSGREEIETELGRGHGSHVPHIMEIGEAVRKAGIKLKVNTVVTKLNFEEDMRPLIGRLRPLRWKVFQMLVIYGQNDAYATLGVSKEEFELFKRTNSDIALESGQRPVFESSEEMVDSYLMLGPDGSAIRNSGQKYDFIPLNEITSGGLSRIVDVSSYQNRGGEYDW
jgi:radical S-adenosyl methionine domain-containing protein 2